MSLEHPEQPLSSQKPSLSSPHIPLCVPAESQQRKLWRNHTAEYVFQTCLLPPLGLNELQQHSYQIQKQYNIPECYTAWMMVILNNELWKKQIQKIPYTQRLLLLPQCLRNPQVCHAQMDQLGLLCEQCGGCVISKLLEKAENLGYTTLVAEGVTLVAQLLRQGSLSAVIGVGCLSALERSFQEWTNQGIPGIAIPLCKEGCRETQVDVNWIEAALEIPYHPNLTLNLSLLHNQMIDCFTFDNLEKLLGKPSDITQQIAYDWLAKAGKRWRPLLVVATYQALQLGESEASGQQQSFVFPSDNNMLLRLAVAVECFHKASLIHDDIEDNDTQRYGMPTLHCQYGIPIALNVGDFLVSEGYRLIAQCGADMPNTLAMLHTAIQGHRHLCLGQGQDLVWRQKNSELPTSNSHPTSLNRPQSPSVSPLVPLISELNINTLLDMFIQKTSPGFNVALQLGAIAAQAPPSVLAMLSAFSQALGIVYQIHDDQQDLPAFIPETMTRQFPNLLQEYRSQALIALQTCHYPELKIFLHRLLAKILE